MFEHAFPERDTRGILLPGEGRLAFSLTRFAPSDDLADIVDWYWIVRWDLPAGTSFTQAVVPHPCVNVVAQDDRLTVHGLARGVDTRTLRGRGHVVAAKFRPGAFRLLVDRPATALAGVVWPADRVFGAASDLVARDALSAAADPDAAAGAVRRLEGLLRDAVVTSGRGAFHRQRLSVVLRAFDVVLAGPVDRFRRVDDLASALGLSVRALQRLFAEYVGVSPKWVLMRHRVHVAAERIADDPEVEVVALAGELGYADQSHFTTDFVRAVGSTPGAYAARCRHTSVLTTAGG